MVTFTEQTRKEHKVEKISLHKSNHSQIISFLGSAVQKHQTKGLLSNLSEAYSTVSEHVLVKHMDINMLIWYFQRLATYSETPLEFLYMAMCVHCFVCHELRIVPVIASFFHNWVFCSGKIALGCTAGSLDWMNNWSYMSKWYN